MQLTNILLVKVIKDDSNWYVPYGLLYITDALEKAGYNCVIWHGHEKELPQLYQLAENLQPLFVGFSVLTDPDLLPAIEASRNLNRMNIPIVWGGIHACILPELCLKQDYVDYIIVGEGEESVVELANVITSEGDFDQIKGLGYKRESDLCFNSPRPFIEELDKYRPAFEKLDLEKYYGETLGGVSQKVLPLITSRGCPHRCGFCYNQAVNRRRWRKHSIDFVLSQAKFLKDHYSIDGVYFDDDNLFTDMERAKEIIDKVNLPYHAEVRADYITNDFIDWVKTTKCTELLIGVESGSQKTLEHINKDMTIEDNRNAINILLQTDICINLSFIIGFPGEDKREMNKTLNLINEFQKSSPKITWVLKAFTPYPGTPLWEDTIARGFNPPTSNENWANCNRYESQLPWLSTEKLQIIKFITSHITISPNRDQSSVKSRFKNRIVQLLVKWRWDSKYFSHTYEITVCRYFLHLLQQLIGILTKGRRWGFGTPFT